MQLLFLDSFDHIATGDDIGRKWTSTGINPQVITGRTGQSGYLWNGALWASRVPPAVRNPIVVGAAIRWSGYANPIFWPGNDIVNRTLYGFRGTIDAASDGRILVKYDLPPRLVAQSDQCFLTVDEWHYIEAYFRLWSTWSMNVETAYWDYTVRVNEELAVSGTYTLGSAEGGWFTPGQMGFSKVDFGPWTGFATDDVYILEGDQFLGDIRVYVIRPNGTGDEAEWSSYGASPAWMAVRDTAPDYGDTYAYTSTVGAKQLFTMEDIYPQGPIKGLQANYMATKSDAGPCAFIPRFKISGEYVEGPYEMYPSWGSWWNFVAPFLNNPVTGQQWTDSEVNDMQVGMRRTR